MCQSQAHAVASVAQGKIVPALNTPATPEAVLRAVARLADDMAGHAARQHEDLSVKGADNTAMVGVGAPQVGA